MNHRRVKCRPLRILGVDLLAVYLDQLLLRLKRGVNRELPIIHKEGAVTLKRVEPLARFLCHTVLNMFVWFVGFELFIFPGSNIATCGT